MVLVHSQGNDEHLDKLFLFSLILTHTIILSFFYAKK